MSVRFTSEAEKLRPKKSSWSLLETRSIVEAVHKAKELGWSDKKVQVRYERIDDDSEIYYVEPYEKGCGCRGMLKYKDYFDA